MHADSKVSGTRRRKNYEGGRKKKGATADNADGADKAENEAVWTCFVYPCYPRYPRFNFWTRGPFRGSGWRWRDARRLESQRTGGRRKIGWSGGQSLPWREFRGRSHPMQFTCQFHGLGLAVQADAPVLAAVQARLHEFPPLPAGERVDWHFDYVPVSGPEAHVVERPSGPSRSVMELRHAEVLYFEATRQLYVEAPGRARVLCDAAAGRVRVSYLATVPDQPWFLSHPLFTIPLHEVLKHQGLYMLHAAALAERGRGLLVAGSSGAGKTTLALTLLRAGFGFLGDDTVFLQRRDTAWSAQAFPDEIDITPQTAAFFPELQRLPAVAAPVGRPKRAISASDVYDVLPQWHAVPAVLVFPQTLSDGASRVAPMSREEALLQLIPNVIRTEVATSQAHLDALAGLVRQCACYRFWAGRDFAAMPALMRSLLEAAP